MTSLDREGHFKEIKRQSGLLRDSKVCGVFKETLCLGEKWEKWKEVRRVVQNLSMKESVPNNSDLKSYKEVTTTWIGKCRYKFVQNHEFVLS